MATTVIQAFNEFLADSVNLDPLIVPQARSSRDWLFAQLRKLHERHDDFPLPYEEKDMMYGSFARKTKIRDLDDIDLICTLHAEGSHYGEWAGELIITTPSTARLWRYCDDGTNRLNSRKVINTFVRRLSDVPQYRKAEIHRNGSAAVLGLTSYSWHFDIVPGFFTAQDAYGLTYYIIPNGQGGWMKTDPRIDRDRISQINQYHSGHVLDIIRVLKYWNRRPTMPSASSYLLECIILDHFEALRSEASQWVDVEIASVLQYISSAILGSIQDPKRIQGDINLLGWEDRRKISLRASSDAVTAAQARVAEVRGDHEESIGLWRDVFGGGFPSYG